MAQPVDSKLIATVPPVRRVVTGTVNGRSKVISDGHDAARAPYWQQLWKTEADDPLGEAVTDGDGPLIPPAGGTHWRVYTLYPESVMREVYASAEANRNVGAGLESRGHGFHSTNTVDYVFILDDQVTLALDDGEVVLRAGDCLVQRATNHAWRNYTDKPVRILVVMVPTAR